MHPNPPSGLKSIVSNIHCLFIVSIENLLNAEIGFTDSQKKFLIIDCCAYPYTIGLKGRFGANRECISVSEAS